MLVTSLARKAKSVGQELISDFNAHDVFLIAPLMTPVAFVFALSLAVASHLPPAATIFTGIVGIFITVLICRKSCSILFIGAAAGLAPILRDAVDALGGGDLSLGYNRVLVIIFLVGLFMAPIGYFRGDRVLRRAISHAIMVGMMAYIGLSLIFKSSSAMTGAHFASSTIYGIGYEWLWRFATIHFSGSNIFDLRARITFFRFSDFNTWVTFTAFSTLALLFLFARLQRRFSWIHPQLWASIYVLILGLLLPFSAAERISIPSNPLTQLGHPDFAGVWEHLGDLWALVALGFARLLITDTAESCAGASAFPLIDPKKRPVDVSKVLMCMGIANIVSGIFGGASNLPGMVKSTTNLRLGARTYWASLACATYLLVLVFTPFGQSIINVYPISGLCAIIGYSAWGMFAPNVWKHLQKIGNDQLWVAIATCVTSVVTAELMYGLAAGVVAELILQVRLSRKIAADSGHRLSEASVWHIIRHLLTNPIRVEHHGDECHVFFEGLVSYAGPLESTLNDVPAGAHIHLTGNTLFICAEAMRRIQDFVDRHGGGLIIHDELISCGKDTTSARRFRGAVAQSYA